MASATEKPSSNFYTSSDFKKMGKTWPFKPDHAAFGCTRSDAGFPEQFVNVDGTLYGLNGTALDDTSKFIHTWREIYNGDDLSDASAVAESLCAPG